jgi:hypothetical protein
MAGKILDKYRIETTVDGVWTPVAGTDNKRSIEIVSIQWSENDGSSTLEIEGAKGKNDSDREDLITSSVVFQSGTNTNPVYYLPPIKLICPLYYKDNGGGGNDIIIQVQDSN